MPHKYKADPGGRLSDKDVDRIAKKLAKKADPGGRIADKDRALALRLKHQGTDSNN